MHTPALIVIVLCIAAVIGCARRPPALPTEGGTPFSDFAAAYREATEQCRGVRTFAGSLELFGRAGGSRVPRTHIEAGFAAPGRIRLEASAGLAFGRPIFILVAEQPDDATLILPRDKRVLTGQSASAILEALAGVALGADELRAIVSGCGPGLFSPDTGSIFENGWVAVSGDRRTMWLRREQGVWRAVAARRSPVVIRYEEWQSGRPAEIRVRAEGQHQPTDLTIRVSDVDMNVPLGAEVFREPIPPDAAPLSLDELRRAGPLGAPAKERP